jgi:CubicO group peptidase (beta-lactamase class C family)
MNQTQKKIQDLLNTLVAEGKERGIQLAVYHDGRLVIDAWAGSADAATGRPMDGRTLVPVFSVGKGLVATIIHMLVERGKLSYDTPIAQVWPEFAAQGKSGILVRHALSHTAGMQLMPGGLTLDEVCDWPTICAALARGPAVSPPGAQMVYHAVTFGWILGEVARRVDGRSFGQLLHDEICQPLGITDLYIGIPPEVESRVATLDQIFPADAPPQPVDNTLPRDVSGAMTPLHAWMNMSIVRRACIPASNGIASARGLARHYAGLLPGGVDGVELLPQHRLRVATTRQFPTAPPPGQEPPRMALGYFLGGPGDNNMSSRLSAFGHGGYGGAMGLADPEHRLAVGLTKNLFSPHGAEGVILREVRQCLGIPD